MNMNLLEKYPEKEGWFVVFFSLRDGQNVPIEKIEEEVTYGRRDLYEIAEWGFLRRSGFVVMREARREPSVLSEQ